jgi:hypothetical protein
MSVPVLALIIVIALPFGAEPQEEFRETYRAWAIAMGTSNPPVVPAGRNVTVQINVTRWSTPEERESLLAQLIENGQEGLVKALQKQEETGWVRATGPTRTGGTRGFPSERLRYAREIKGEGGKRRLILAMDRPISFWEAANNPRWRDYDMTLIVMDLDAEGKGEGQLAMGVRLSINEERTLVIENFGTEPVRLTNISRTDSGTD